MLDSIHIQFNCQLDLVQEFFHVSMIVIRVLKTTRMWENLEE